MREESEAEYMGFQQIGESDPVPKENSLIYPIELKTQPTANQGWEYYLIVGRTRCGPSIYSDEWVSPDKILIRLIKTIANAY